MKVHLIASLMVCGLVVTAAGCTSYYRVTDPSSGKAYYTTKVDDVRGGAVKIKDGKTGSTVTLQSSEVKEISEDEYNTGMMAQASAKPVTVQPVSAQPAAVQPADLQPKPVPSSEQAPAQK
jgi:uncharacterized protein YceK